MLSKILLRILRRTFPQRISVKLGLVICLLVVILLCVLGLALTSITQNVLKRSVRNSHQEIAVRSAGEISLFVNRPVELLQTAAKLISRTAMSSWDQETVLVEMSLEFPMYKEIVSVNAKGREIASSNPGRQRKNFILEEPFLRAVRDKVYLSPIWIGEDYLPLMTVSLSHIREGKITGVLIAEVSLQGMWDIVDAIHVGETGRAFLISKKGLILAHPDKKLVLQNKNVSSYPQFESMVSGKSGSVEYHGEDGKAYLASFAPVESSVPLFIVIQREIRDAYGLLDQMRLLIWFVIAASLLVSMVVSFLIAKWLVQPVKSLQLWSKKVALGDFDYQIPPRSLDEIGRLFIMFRKMSERLKAAQRKEHFAAFGMAASAISHKLKNSIVSLKTFAQVFPFRKNDAHFVQRFEKDFGETIERLEKIFNNLSQVASSRILKKEMIHLPKFFQFIQHSFGETMARMNIEFQTKIDGHLPPIEGDREQLQELFVNLVQNSMQAMPRGGSLFLIALHEPWFPLVKMMVQDSGVGISRQNLEQIFKPFFTTKQGGMGLGLSISKKIVEDHGGQISVTSTEGHGAIFTITIPVSLKKRVVIEAPSASVPV